jgi:hypothetical protein
MAHRHYGLQGMKPPTNKRSRSGARRGRALVSAVVVITILIGIILYGVAAMFL